MHLGVISYIFRPVVLRINFVKIKYFRKSFVCVGPTHQDKWSTSYCPTDGCIAKCQHLQQPDRGGTWCEFGAEWMHRFISGDLNNDGLCDIICIGYPSGMVDIQYRQSSNFGPTIRLTNNFCNGFISGSYPLIMDVNNDTYDDILCVFDDVPNDDQVRAYYIAGKAEDMTFPEVEVSNITLSSGIIALYGNQTLTGDFDGDGFCDIACHTSDNRLHIMIYTVDMRRLHPPYWVIAKNGYVATSCNFNTQHLALIDLDRDGRVEIICGESSDPSFYPYRILSTLYPDNGPFVAHSGVPGWMQINSSDIFNLDGDDPPISCSTSVKLVSGSSTVNPCENVTLNVAYLQADATSVLDTTVGSFCRESSTSLFISADVDGNGYCDMICQDTTASIETSVYVQYLANDGMTYETRHNMPVGTAGLGPNFTCTEMGHLFTYDFNGDNRCAYENYVLWSSACVLNGVVACDTTQLRFEVTCKTGYQLRGHRLIGCASGSYYMTALPLCREIKSGQNYRVYEGNGLQPTFSSDAFLASVFDPLNVVFTDNLQDCIWACEITAQCISATMTNHDCTLFAYQAKGEMSTDGKVLAIVPDQKIV